MGRVTMYYHVTTTDHDSTFTADTGGHYEHIDPDTGCPDLVHGPDGPIGFTTSDKPAVCGSKTPSGALFASIWNHKLPDTYYVYQTPHEPDTDISDCGLDFGIIDEVRWHNPHETPVPFTRAHTVTVPERATLDVRWVYRLNGSEYDPNTAWADAVTTALGTLINTGTYPDDLWATYDDDFEELYGIDRGHPHEDLHPPATTTN